jgi:hypothetical protein
MVKGKAVPVYTMKTFRGSTVTTALICNLSRKQVSDQPHASAASTLGKDPQHPLNRRPDVPRACLMFWINASPSLLLRNKPHMVQSQDYHYID